MLGFNNEFTVNSTRFFSSASNYTNHISKKANNNSNNKIPLEALKIVAKNIKQNITTASPLLAPSRTKLTKRTIYVFETEFQVDLPEEYDIYEGLRRWYPILYKVVIAEEKYWQYRSQIALEDDEFDYTEPLNYEQIVTTLCSS